MICANIKPKLRDYCEDSVPETQRNQIRDHLKGCRECREYSFAFSSFGTDLRRFAALEPPGEIKEKIIQQAEAAASAEVSGPQFLKAYWILILAAALILTGGIVLYKNRKPVVQPVEEPAVQALPEPEILSVEEADEDQQQSPLASSRFDISLRPFHWDVEFPSPEKRSEFVEALRKQYGAVATAHFESPAMVVFSVDRPGLLDILKLLTQLGAGVKGSRTIPSYIPDFPNTVRVSMSLETAQSRITKTLSHHWHLRFEYPNKFTVKEKLRNAGGRMLYETAEVWIMEFSGRDFEKIHDIFRGAYGLSTNVGPEQFLSTRSRDQVPIRITMYIEEG